MPRRLSNPRVDLLGDESDVSETFQSPEEDINQTSYGLEYSSNLPNLNFQPSTSRNVPTRQPTARKKTGGRPPEVRQEIPRTESSMVPSRQTVPRGSSRRKIRRPVHRRVRVLQEIKKLQDSTNILIPRLSFARLVREILMGMMSEVNRITMVAMKALHEATEVYVTYQLQDAYTLTLHRGRVTLSVKDMELLRFLRGRI